MRWPFMLKSTHREIVKDFDHMLIMQRDAYDKWIAWHRLMLNQLGQISAQLHIEKKSSELRQLLREKVTSEE